jgi:hypothetical protein
MAIRLDTDFVMVFPVAKCVDWKTMFRISSLGADGANPPSAIHVHRGGCSRIFNPTFHIGDAV